MPARGIRATEGRPDLASESTPPTSEDLLIREAKRRHRKRLFVVSFAVAAVTAGVVLAAVGISGNTPRPNPPVGSKGRDTAGGMQRCAPGQLSISLGDNFAGAGTRAFMIVFHNTSESSCQMEGYPRVVVLNAASSPAGVVIHAPLLPGNPIPHTIRMSPGDAAHALVSTGGVELHGDRCVTWRSIRVAPPGATTTTRIALKWKPDQGPNQDGLTSCGRAYLDPLAAGVPSDYSPTPSLIPLAPGDLPSRTTVPSN